MPKKKKQENTPLYLKNVKLSGYKTIRKVEIDLDKGLNIIIGKNGTGKTNFLEFIRFSTDINNKEILESFYAELEFLRDKDVLKSITTHSVSISSQKTQFGLNNVKTNTKISFIKNDEVLLKETDNEDLVNQFIGENDIFLFGFVFAVYGIPQNVPCIDNIFSFKLAKGNLELLNFIDSDNEYIPSFIYKPLLLIFLTTYKFFNKEETIEEKEILKNFKNLENIIKISNKTLGFIKKYTPLQDIRLSKSYNFYYDKQKQEILINNLFFEFKIYNQWLPFDSLSDGTKRIFYLIAEIGTKSTLITDNQEFDNKIILLEEPELGIHPHQLDLLMEFLKEYSKECQIILTTHSPQVLDILGKDELHKIIIAEMTEDGTKLRHLTEEETKKAQNYMENEALLSDYWRFSDLER
ncbi:MAG: AAA family ATPase [Flavobacterium sp.]|nr:AAA family ATPase [Flavobacterium sp.]